ncbi:MAG: tetratricopeptide repeat protein [bacterium]
MFASDGSNAAHRHPGASHRARLGWILLALWLPIAAVASAEPANAPASDAPRLLAEARALDRGGASADALTRFEEITGRFPDAPESAEAHYQAARLRQRRLGDLEGALAHYRALAQQFPTSRWSAGVPARVSLLESALADGTEALARYESILQRHTRSEANEIETADALEGWARAYPDFPLVPRALLFVARARRHHGDPARAVACYQQIRERFGERVEAFEAGKALGEMRFEKSDFRGAKTAWASLFPVQSADQAVTLQGLIARAEGHLRRQVVAAACAAYLAAFAGCAWWLGGRWRPLPGAARSAGRELAVLLPPLGLLLWLAYPNTIVTYFLASFTAAVIPLLVLHVACVQGGRLRRRAAVPYALAVSGALGALTYVLLYAWDLAFVLERPLRWVSA